jgi:hypothetical protein
LDRRREPDVQIRSHPDEEISANTDSIGPVDDDANRRSGRTCRLPQKETLAVGADGMVMPMVDAIVDIVG